MYRSFEILTPRGALRHRQYGPSGLDDQVVMVGGVGGGFDSPARNLYDRLGDELPSHGVGALRVEYRDARDLRGSVEDLSEAIHELTLHGARRVVLIGHSMGGAVVVNAAIRHSEIAGVIALSTQLGGMDDLEKLRTPILFIHGTDDEILPPACSVRAWRMAHEPRRLELMDGAKHCLEECADQVTALVRRFLDENLRTADLSASK